MIPIYRPSIRRKEMDAVLSSMVADTLVDGIAGKNFAKELAAALDADYAVLLREYERAISLALDALDLEPDYGVIVSPLASKLYGDAVKQKGFNLLVADVDADTMTLNIESVQKLLETNSKAALVVDSPFGFIPDMESLKELEIPMIEDISTTIGAHDGKQQCGTYGDVLVLRMETGDIMTVGGGAAVLTSRRKFTSKLKKIVEEWPVDRFLTDMNSSLGSAQLRDQDKYFVKRREIYSLYNNAVRKGRHSTPIQKSEAEQVFHYFPVFIKGGVRDVQSYARKKGVSTVQAFGDSIIAHNGVEEMNCEGAKQIYKRCVLFPLFPMLSKKEIETISKVLSTLP